LLKGAGAALHSSTPVVIETFPFPDRNANRDVAQAWKAEIYKPRTVRIITCELRDVYQSWDCVQRTDLHELSAVDATSFAIMRPARMRIAYTFNHHFAVVGFRLVT